MDELPQQNPPQSPSSDPEPLPFIPDNLSAPIESSMKRKAIIATALVMLVAAGGIIADPLNLFEFDVSRQQAAEPSLSILPSRTPTNQAINAVCQGVSVPVVRVNWQPLADVRVNALERSTNSGTFVPIYYESADPPFANASFTDRDIVKGTTYSYRVFGATTPVATVTCN